MTTERIKEIQQSIGYPDNVPVQQALLKVWNEVAQENRLKPTEWINVENRLPSPEMIGKKILIVYKGEIHLGKIASNGWNLFCSDGECWFNTPINDVTHWMPLPNFKE